MHPAYSVILFTTASGVGYGLLIWLALAQVLANSGLLVSPQPWVAFWSASVALILISIGLFASTFHLGHPERAWRSFSQWRSSWLSREAVFAVLTYPIALIFIVSSVWDGIPVHWARLCAGLLILLSVATVVATGMIYASLKTIPRWSNHFVVPLYLLLAMGSGGLIYLLALRISQQQDISATAMLSSLLLITWLVKWRYWHFIDRQRSVSTTATATGLGRGEGQVDGQVQVRQLDAPHTSENYLLQEMGYVVARKHSLRLRNVALILGWLLPTGGLLLAAVVATELGLMLELISLISGFVGVLIERWLFFAEARHAVTLFYGRSL